MITKPGYYLLTRTHFVTKFRRRTFTRIYQLTFPSGLIRPIIQSPSEIPTGVNKKLLGMIKDEAGARQITEFVGLRSKLYAYTIESNDESRKCKGVKKKVVKNYITFQQYKDGLIDNTIYQAKFNTLRSRKHEITNECTTKVALSASDDKRYIIPNNPEHKMLALGHCSLDVQ